MTGNIIGEPTEPYVVNQVKTRQKVYGKGFEKNSVRSTEELLYLNNRNAWIKMASSVSITNVNLRLPLGLNNTSEFDGIDLSKKAILFNGLSSFNGSTLQQREGVNIGATAVTDSYYNNSVYGLGGTQFGIQPMPGISSVSITNKNRGSIRTATVEITAFNRFQFEVIETLYLRLGFTMLIEWGWDKYFDNNNKLQSLKTSFIENGFFNISNQDFALKQINLFKKQYEGNYDGFFGRVVNFNWQFENDGSYSISIKLTSLGDVVESLTINQGADDTLKNELNKIPKTNKGKKNRFGLLEENKSIIYTNKASTKLGAILYKKLYDEDLFGTPKTTDPPSPYFNLYKAFENDNEYNTGEEGKKRINSLNTNYCYYISFGELCDILQNEIIPDVNENVVNQQLKQIKIDTNENLTICSYTPNLISFDPKICITNMVKPKEALNKNGLDVFYPTYTQYLKEFVVEEKTEEGSIMYGKIYNIYLNYDMIFKSLKNNSDIKNKLSLFKFLKDICDKVNTAFGNVIDIEPIIKNEKEITFIDQKPVIGLSKNLEKVLGTIPTETAKLEVYGFNGESYEGTFLKNISFNTKISPKLSSQLSIGATARGVATGEDSTGYSNWNKGLVDRFQTTITDPKSEPKKDTKKQTDDSDDGKISGAISFTGESNLKNALKNLTTQETSALIEFELSNYPISVTSTYTGNSVSTITNYGTVTVKGEISTDKGVLKSNLIAYGTKLSQYKLIYSEGTTLEQIYNDATNYKVFGGDDEQAQTVYIEVSKAIAKAYGRDNYSPEFDDQIGSDVLISTEEQQDDLKQEQLKRTKKLASLNYSAYITLMFGGNPNVTEDEEGESGIIVEPVTKADSQYLVMQSGEDSSEIGKKSYKKYLNEYFANIFNFGGEDSKSPSNQIGFIPVEFDMEMDGISGFKIYNKIDINQRFLPSNYGESLEFLVKGLNHKIDAKGWTTNLQTLSTSNLNAIPLKQTNSSQPTRQSKPLGVTNLTTPTSENYAGDPNLQPIKDLIASVESNFNYSIANTGTKSPYTKLQLSTTKVDTLTINQILNEYSSTYTDRPPKERVFAAGRYQLIPPTLKQAVNNNVVKESDLYSPTTQEKLGNWLVLKKRPKVGDYLSASNTGTKEDLEKAVDSLAKEFASFPAISFKDQKVGDVVSGNGNKARYGGQGGNPSNSKIGVNSVVQALIDSRIKYSGSPPSYIPSYVKINT